MVILQRIWYTAGLRATKYFIPLVNWKRKRKYAANRGMAVIVPYMTNVSSESAYFSMMIILSIHEQTEKRMMEL